jgi:hypothetical protein
MTEMRSLFGPEMQSGVINFCFLKITNDAAAGIIDISVEAPIFTHSQTNHSADSFRSENKFILPLMQTSMGYILLDVKHAHTPNMQKRCVVICITFRPSPSVLTAALAIYSISPVSTTFMIS